MRRRIARPVPERDAVTCERLRVAHGHRAMVGGGEMSIRSTSSAVILTTLLAVGVPAATWAQDDGTESQVCLTVIGTAPEGGWEPLSLSVAIASGNATIAAVGPASECAGTDVPVVVDGPVATPEPAGDAPLPVELVEAGFSVKDGNVSYTAVVSNPNPSAWVANYMPVRFDFYDADDGLVTTATGNTTLLPGQTGAVIGTTNDAQGATRMEVVIANGENDWQIIDEIAGEFTFSDIKTRATDYGPTTTGRISSTFEEQVDDVRVDVVYKDAAGKVLGGSYTYVDFVPAGGQASFKVSTWSEINPKKAAQTDVYYSYYPF
jgi:hypothetical protein